MNGHPTDSLLTPVRRVWRYWVALLVPALAWSGRLVFGWAVAEVACGSEAGLGLGYYLVQSALLLGAAAVTVWSGWVAWRLWREHGKEEDPLGPASFLSLSGVLAAITFLVLIVAEGSAVYVLGCA